MVGRVESADQDSFKKRDGKTVVIDLIRERTEMEVVVLDMYATKKDCNFWFGTCI